MSIRRVYVEKKPGEDVTAQRCLTELQQIFHIKGLSRVRMLVRYDVEGLTDAAFEQAVHSVFSEPQVDVVVLGQLSLRREDCVVAVELLPGQYSQRADSAAQCIQLITQGQKPPVQTATVWIFEGALTSEELLKIKEFLINPVESREASMAMPESLAQAFTPPEDVPVLQGFIRADADGLQSLHAELGLAMDMADLRFCQAHFRDEQQRDPTLCELRMLDTYWSDHCRHTTFLTKLAPVTFDNPLAARLYDEYLAVRERTNAKKDICLMDLATLAVRDMKKQGLLTNLDESQEINACSIKIPVEVDGGSVDYLLQFKNETHNHPTEIEPFGGAATCLGGAIRDPLSGRAYVHQAMRITGAGDPRVAVSDTLPGKLPQRRIVQTAAAGYSSYGNQIGLATGFVQEYYHPGFVAKRMELGAVVAACPAANVRREVPDPGDVVILLGGATGRDGCGGATGSSKAHTEDSLTSCGAEVQKGNPPEERKLQRLFRNPEATLLIKRCNDFGAGGVSVAVGELADGLCVDLDCVPKKYEGLNGVELAISESQERMAVVVEADHAAQFIALANAENLEATVIATVTEAPELRMLWRGKTIACLPRNFLNSNGAAKTAAAHVKAARLGVAGAGAAGAGGGTVGADAAQNEKTMNPSYPPEACADLKARWLGVLQDLNVCSQKGLVERFDSTNGAGSVLMPFGGKNQSTPAQAMVAKIPLERGRTDTASVMAAGYDPVLSSQSPLHGGTYAVVEALAKVAASGADTRKAYFTFQEYFPRPGTDPARWGQPLAALLGAFWAQERLGLCAIGGKDSMSGTFGDMDVPPTLCAFAVAPTLASATLTPELKQTDSALYRLYVQRDADGLPDVDLLKRQYAAVYAAASRGGIRAAYALTMGGLAAALPRMAFGNDVGVELDALPTDFFDTAYGDLILEVAEPGYASPQSDDASPQAKGTSLQADRTALQPRGAAPQVENSVPKSEEGADAQSNACAVSQSDWAALHILPIGRTIGDAELRVLDDSAAASTLGVFGDSAGNPAIRISLAEAHAAWESPLESIFPTHAPQPSGTPVNAVNALPRTLFRTASVAQPLVVFPVFPGTNCEYDSVRAFADAGARTRVVLVRNRTAQDIAESVLALETAIRDAQIIMIPGGFSGGDEPDGSAKLIVSLFRNPRIADATHDLLKNRDGLMLGICNGFQALIKLGLVPYGEIRPRMTPSDPTLTFNRIGRHVSQMVHTQICTVRSPWFGLATPGQIDAVPVSHGEGRLAASPEDVAAWLALGQIATQYVDLNGQATYDVRFNPNGSTHAIEGLLSPDGRVLGKMGHTERADLNLYRNIPMENRQGIFAAGVLYYQ